MPINTKRGRQALFLAALIVGIVLVTWAICQRPYQPILQGNEDTVVHDGLINRMISNMNFELHVPKYRFCGPGTKLGLRLERGDVPRNQLDAACKLHDMAYQNSANLVDRHRADQVLLEAASQRRTASDSSWEESFVACVVAFIMKLKLYFGF